MENVILNLLFYLMVAVLALGVFVCSWIVFESSGRTKLIILGLITFFVLTSVIIMSDIMHQFIVYLKDIGFVGSIYWYIMGAVVILLPLLNSLIIRSHKSSIVKISALTITSLLFWICTVILVGNFYVSSGKL
jgi:hypothetical protein